MICEYWGRITEDQGAGAWLEVQNAVEPPLPGRGRAWNSRGATAKSQKEEMVVFKSDLIVAHRNSVKRNVNSLAGEIEY